MLRQWLNRIFGPTPNYAVGDTVQPVSGVRELMVITRIIIENDTPRLHCHWLDSVTQEKRERWFSESELEPFDWRRPMQSTSLSSRTMGLERRDDSVQFESQPAMEEFDGVDVQQGLSHLMGNQELFEKMLRKFADQQSDFVEEINRKITGGEWEEVRRMAHTLKGLAGTLGMTNLQSLSSQLETESLRRDAGALPAPVAQLSAELSKIIRSIRSTIKEHPSVVEVPKPSNLGSALDKLEKTLLDGNPDALRHLDGIGRIEGCERELGDLRKSVDAYRFDHASEVLRTIRNRIKA